MSFLKQGLIQSTMAVGFTKLKICCFIGVLPHEQTQLQEIIVDLKLHLAKPPSSLEISSTIDYSELAEFCKTLIGYRHRGLLETLASELLNALFDRFACSYAWIRIEKPAAIPSAECGFVEFEKEISV